MEHPLQTSGRSAGTIKKWIIDFDGPRYANVDAATKVNIANIKSAYKQNPVPKGIWVKVEAPKLNSANIVPLDTIIHAW